MKSKNFKSTDNETLSFFDKLSNEWWDEWGSFKALHSYNLIRLNFIKNKIARKSLKNLRILDIGCGGGILCEPLTRLGAIVTGIDTNERAIRVAKNHANEKNLKITYKNLELEQIKREKFDIITCMEVLEHVDDVENVISLSQKLLRKNGYFFGSTINKSLSSYFLALFVAENILNLVPKGTHEWRKLLRPNYLKKLFLQNNFNDFQIKGVIYNPFKNKWKYSNNTRINYIFSVSNS